MASGNVVTSSIPNLIGGVSQQPWNVRMASQAEEQINCHASITEFMRRRPAFKHIAPVASPDGSNNFTVFPINKGTDERYIALFGKGGIRVYDLEGVEQTVTMSDSGREYLGQLKEASTDLRFCSIKDYVFCSNKQVIVSEGKTDVVARTPECVVFIKQASFQTTYNLTLDGKTYSYTTPSGTYEEGTEPPELSAESILRNLRGQLPSSYKTTLAAPVLWIRKDDSSYFTFSTSDSRSDTHIFSFRDTSKKMTDLPLVSPNGITLRITGDGSTDLDDYYVKFETNNSAEIGEGNWKETASPTLNSKLDPATMPHALIRRKANNFSFEPIEWAERVAGDETTNPMPSFVGKPIANVLYYRNRLCFLSGDNVVMSEANELFNFFLTTVTTAVDSDPIDVAASGTKDTSLYGYAIYNGGLVLFSTKGQFHLEHDTVLANSTVSLTPVTEFESTDRVSPVSSGKSIFFAVDRGQWVGIREYISFDTDDYSSTDSVDVSSHVPRYIPGKADDLQCSSNEDILLVRSASEKDAMWVYKYFWDGNEKVQSSWYRWKLAGDILSASFFDAEVYSVMGYKDGSYTLETFSFEPQHKDEGEDFEFCLDRKIDETSLTLGEYDSITRTTSVTVPFTDEDLIFITRSGGDLKAGSIIPVVSKEGSTYTLKAKVTDKTKMFIGVPFSSEYTFTTLAIRNENNTAITTGRLQVRSISLNLSRSGYVDVEVSPKNGPTSVFSFTGKRLGEDSSVIGDIPIYTGQIKAAVLSKNDRATIKIKSDSPLPFAVVNADWEGFYTTRSQKL